MNFGARFDMRTNVLLHDLLTAIRNNSSANPSIAFQHSEYDGFTSRTACLAAHHAFFAVFVHVASFAAYKSLIDLDLTGQHAAGKLILHRKADSMTHEPSGLLGPAKSSVKFPRT